MHKIEEPHFGTEQGRVYGEALDALDRAGTRYMLGGTLALDAYTGLWRDTKDLDVFALGEDVERAPGAPKGAGFETEVVDPCWLAKAHKGDLFVDVVHSNHNALVPVEGSWFENARESPALRRHFRRGCS